MEALCALAAVAGVLWLPTPVTRAPGSAVERAWSTVAEPGGSRARLDVAARGTPPRLETGGLSLLLPREAVALRRAAQALGYTMPDPDAAAPPTSAQLLVDPQTIEFRSGTRLCVRYVARF